MKFTALLVSAASALVIWKPKYTPPPGYYYNANQLDAALNANIDVDVDLNVDIALFKKVCTRGSYGGYDA